MAVFAAQRKSVHYQLLTARRSVWPLLMLCGRGTMSDGSDI